MGKAARLKRERKALTFDLESEYEAHLDLRMDGRIVCDDCGFEQEYRYAVPCTLCGGESGMMLRDLFEGTGP